MKITTHEKHVYLSPIILTEREIMDTIEKLKQLKSQCEKEKNLERENIVSIYDVGEVLGVNAKTVYDRAMKAKIPMFKFNCPERCNRLSNYLRVEDAEKLIRMYYSSIANEQR
jgi:hypothetical protein